MHAVDRAVGSAVTGVCARVAAGCLSVRPWPGAAPGPAPRGRPVRGCAGWPGPVRRAQRQGQAGRGEGGGREPVAERGRGGVAASRGEDGGQAARPWADRRAAYTQAESDVILGIIDRVDAWAGVSGWVNMTPDPKASTPG